MLFAGRGVAAVLGVPEGFLLGTVSVEPAVFLYPRELVQSFLQGLLWKLAEQVPSVPEMEAGVTQAHTWVLAVCMCVGVMMRVCTVQPSLGTMSPLYSAMTAAVPALKLLPPGDPVSPDWPPGGLVAVLVRLRLLSAPSSSVSPGDGSCFW